MNQQPLSHSSLLDEEDDEAAEMMQLPPISLDDLEFMTNNLYKCQDFMISEKFQEVLKTYKE